MSELEQKTAESVKYIRDNCPLKPKIAVILGSGLGEIAKDIENAYTVEYRDIPHFAQSTAPGHAGRLVIGKLGETEVLCMQGRMHYYEGNGMDAVVYPIRVMAKLGIETLILSNAAGGINLSFMPGDIMMITDHINFMGVNPLVGPNEESFGVRFSDMSYAYNHLLRRLAEETASELGIELKKGVYLACSGPSYETPAEIRAFRVWGVDAVGMSTVPEVIVANHCGIKVAAFSCISNMAAGILDQPLTEEEVLAAGEMVSGKMSSLVKNLVAKIDRG